MTQAEILAEVARIEHELGRLSGELASLRQQLAHGAPPGSGRRMTMAFSAPPPPADAPPPPATMPSIPPPPRTRTRGRSMAPPSLPRDLAANSVESVPPPPPRVRTRSSIVPAAPHSDAPESAPQTQSSGRRPPEAGRYGFVSEGKSRASRGR